MSVEFFFNIKSFRSHYSPGVDSASNRNEYLGRKGGRCVRLTTLPPSCAVVMKSGNLNFLEPSGPLQACNVTTLPLPLHLPFFITRPRNIEHKMSTEFDRMGKKAIVANLKVPSSFHLPVEAGVKSRWNSSNGNFEPMNFLTEQCCCHTDHSVHA